MAIKDYVVIINAEEYGLKDESFPTMTITFNDFVVAENIKVASGDAACDYSLIWFSNHTTNYYSTLLPEWMRIKAQQDIKPRFMYKFIITVDDCIDNNEVIDHKIKFKFDDTNIDNGIRLIEVFVDGNNLLIDTTILNHDNNELEVSFKMPLIPYRKVINYDEKKNDSTNFFYLFPTPASSGYLKNHECRDKVIEMIDHYYDKKDPTLYYNSEKRFLTNNLELKPLWISFQEEFDKFTNEFGLPRVLVSSSWFVLYDSNLSLASHVHSGAILVGTYYPHVEGNASPVTFEHPYHDIIQRNNIKRLSNNITDSEGCQIEEFNMIPKTEMFNIFPGYARHYVRPNTSNKNIRYIVVANTILYSEKEKLNFKDLRYETV